MNNKTELIKLLQLQNENLFKDINLNTNVLIKRYINALLNEQLNKTKLIPTNLNCICENFFNIGNIIVNETNNYLQTIYINDDFSSINNIDKFALTCTEIKV